MACPCNAPPRPERRCASAVQRGRGGTLANALATLWPLPSLLRSAGAVWAAWRSAYLTPSEKSEPGGTGCEVAGIPPLLLAVIVPLMLATW